LAPVTLPALEGRPLEVRRANRAEIRRLSGPSMAVALVAMIFKGAASKSTRATARL